MSPDTPQQNGIIELVFDTIYFWMHEIIMHAGLYEKLNTGPCTEYASTATKIKKSW